MDPSTRWVMGVGPDSWRYCSWFAPVLLPLVAFVSGFSGSDPAGRTMEGGTAAVLGAARPPVVTGGGGGCGGVSGRESGWRDLQGGRGRAGTVNLRLPEAHHPAKPDRSGPGAGAGGPDGVF